MTTKTGPTIAQLRRDLAAYKRAKQENDDRFMRERDEARAELARVTAERDELRAIFDGRTTPPTTDEADAHHAAGGSWLFLYACGTFGGATIRDGKVFADDLPAWPMDYFFRENIGLRMWPMLNAPSLRVAEGDAVSNEKRLTAEDLAVIEVRASAATEWSPENCEVCTDGYDGHKYACQGATLGQTLVQLADTYDGSDRDWIFLAHARTDVPDLIAEVRALTAERDEAREDFDSMEYDAAALAVEWENLGVGGRAEVAHVAPRLTDALDVLAGNGREGWARTAIAKVAR